MIIQSIKEKDKIVKEFININWKEFDKTTDHTFSRKTEYFIAKESGRITGFVEVEICGGVMEIMELIVDQKRKRQGIGKALIERCERLAREKSCFKIILHTSEDHKEALKFYDKLGYKIECIQKDDRYHKEWYILSKKLNN
jgi:ribosomal protein S18 acetylase RimI-like enzyme